MTPDEIEKLALSLFDIGAVRMGRFTLHSGRISPIYFDLRLLVSFPAVLQHAAEAYTALLQQLRFDILAAYPYAALPIGVAIALHTNWPLVYPRKETKEYGTAKQIEGAWQAGQTAVVIEDLITSGDSIMSAIAVLQATDLRVQDAVVLIDRQQGGREALLAQGYRLHSVLAIDHLLSILQRRERISSQQRAEVLEALS